MKSLRLLTGIAAALLAVFSAIASVATDPSPREHLSLDANWKFHLGDDWPNALRLDKAGTSGGPASAKFNDQPWRTLNLPHDWAIELPFDRNSDGSHGFKPVGPGFERNSIGWYRRSFTLSPADAGKRIWLQFDGAYRDTTVWVNGWIVARHESGYSPFRCDVTDIVRLDGPNTIAVKVDATKFEGWFYEGAGIYRHVWLDKTAPVAIAPDGIFVSTKLNNGVTEIDVAAQIQNQRSAPTNDDYNVYANFEIIDPHGKSVAEFSRHLGQPVVRDALELKAGSRQTVRSFFVFFPPNKSIRMLLATPRDETKTVVAPTELWSPESPKLYKLITTVTIGEKSSAALNCFLDRQETEFGIRTVGFDANHGFLLNGQPYELKGTCNHQDMAGVGAALPDALQYFRIAKLKEFGDNAYRTSHNPPTPELLQACDRLGMIVLDENRVLGSDEENLKRLHDLVVRDRSHPSVCIWSICNEEYAEQKSPAGGQVGATMQRLVHELDPTRPVTAAENVGNDYPGLMATLDVRGWNYYVGTNYMDKYHAEHPSQPNVGTEQGSTVSTRGIYENDKKRGYVSAYDVNAPPWAHTAETWWSFFATRPWLSGGFVWTGFDYRGEPTPYSWPCINSHFGILDTCGFPKDNFYYYQAWWSTNLVLHLLPHWNWPGKEGQEIRVDALSNCQEVELFLNGQSLGRKSMARNSKLSWPVKYSPGVLSAKGYNDGRLVAETKVETTGQPAAVTLTPDRSTINANGEDVSAVTVSVTDDHGRVVPVASDKIQFSLTGPGKIIGVGNGDPSSHEPDTYLPTSSIRAVPANDWRWQVVDYDQKTLSRTRLPEYTSDFNDSAWSKTSSSDASQLSGPQAAVFRQHLTLTADDLKSPAIQIHFGRIDDNGWIYVNGQRVGESDDWQDSPAYEIKSCLHVGDNVITVGILNEDGEGGLTLGVNLEFIGQAAPAAWSRSVFNGLAQVLVQAGKDAGTINVSASADVLQTGTVSIQTVTATPRPSVP